MYEFCRSLTVYEQFLIRFPLIIRINTIGNWLNLHKAGFGGAYKFSVCPNVQRRDLKSEENTKSRQMLKASHVAS